VPLSSLQLLATFDAARLSPFRAHDAVATPSSFIDDLSEEWMR